MISKYIPPLAYWFDIAPPPLQGWTFVLPLFIFIIVFIGGLAAKIMASRMSDFKLRTIFFKFGSLGWVMGLSGVLLIFFEFERVALLRMRIFFIAWMLVAIIWTAAIVIDLKKELPSRLEKIKEFMAKKKYLPKKK